MINYSYEPEADGDARCQTRHNFAFYAADAGAPCILGGHHCCSKCFRSLDL